MSDLDGLFQQVINFAYNEGLITDSEAEALGNQWSHND